MVKAKARVIGWYQKYEKFMPASFFVAGFIFDLLTLGRIDDPLNIISQSVYLVLCTWLLLAKIVVGENDFSGGRVKGFIWKYRVALLHFMMGALLSVYTIFYFQSASSGLSFLFLGVMILLLFINEFEFFQTLGLYIKFALLALCYFSFFAYLIPTLVGFMSPWFTYLAMALTMLVFWGLAKLIVKRREVDEWLALRELMIPAGLIMALIAGLNVAKAIPPVPMSATYMGVFHKIEKEYPEYKLYYTRSKWKFWQNGDEEFLARPGDKIYFFASVFSPGTFKDQIFVRWLWKNSRGKWMSTDQIPVQIVGGRDEGFRGVTYKENYTPGDWMVRLETRSERVIGKLQFKVIEDKSTETREYHELIK